MPTESLNPVEWRDQQGESRYPFADGATLQADTGLELDRRAIVDACLHPPGSTGAIYLSAVVVDAGRATLWFGDAATSRLASGTIDTASPSVTVEIVDSLGRAAGLLVTDATYLGDLQGWPVGTHEFTLTAGALSASAAVPVPAYGVTGFLLDSGEVVSGDAWLVGEDGVVLSEPAADIIRVDVVGDPLFRRRLCTPSELFTTPAFLKTINGVSPDQFGRFVLTTGERLKTDNVIRVYVDGDDIVIEAVGQKAGAA